ncbi:hypothetical protein KUV51_20980 [Tateyamaria omphalii]|uniref:hypothetical protein n=1 Tax=Tateyamaria omphalii TaxID=299262 RepID=UPI001C996E1F|nr:hypothetical protein [Tateyamaria omphalii]MBY5935495.1 hypothetical protein [Tateyamaria omphalii]
MTTPDIRSAEELRASSVILAQRSRLAAALAERSITKSNSLRTRSDRLCVLYSSLDPVSYAQWVEME